MGQGGGWEGKRGGELAAGEDVIAIGITAVDGTLGESCVILSRSSMSLEPLPLNDDGMLDA